MSDTAILAEGVGKLYRTGQREPYRALRDTLMDVARAPWRALTGNGKAAEHSFWALKDVSFEMKQGEAIGIIGRNGAGKSTLLKILSRVTEPTAGRVRLRGRVGALLEVGTGFHPELTGRENIFLNGAILGMKHADIVRKFDAIVAFAEVAEFLDLPVKRYSSGMFTRLAFAVAAHLEPEILIVDEVLAVGDAQFQKKCLGKMGEVAKGGRTVLFVSHNMHAIQRLCTRAFLLQAGACVRDGPAKEVVDHYLNKSSAEQATGVARDVSTECRDKDAYFTHWRLKQSGVDDYSLLSGAELTLVLGLKVLASVPGAFLGIAIWAEDGTLVWAASSHDGQRDTQNLLPGYYEATFALGAFPVRPGKYSLETSINIPKRQLDHWHATPELTLLHSNTTLLPERWRGLLDLSYSFVLERGEPRPC